MTDFGTARIATRRAARAPIRRPLDVPVVNSGFAILGDAPDQDPDEIDWLFRVNVYAPHHALMEAARATSEGGRITVIR